MRFCSKCQTQKTEEEFYASARWCKACRLEYNRKRYTENRESVRISVEKWREANREKHNSYNTAYRLENREKVKAGIKAWTDRNPLRRFASQSLGLKKRAGHNVTLTIDDVLNLWTRQDGKCALSGLSMQSNFGKKGGGPDSPSLDRIVPSLGYVPGNVRLLRYCVNAGRGTLNDDEYIEVCRAVVRQAELALQMLPLVRASG